MSVKRTQQNVTLPVAIHNPDGEFLTAKKMNSTFMLNITWCRLVEIDGRFGGTYAIFRFENTGGLLQA